MYKRSWVMVVDYRYPLWRADRVSEPPSYQTCGRGVLYFLSKYSGDGCTSSRKISKWVISPSPTVLKLWNINIFQNVSVFEKVLLRVHSNHLVTFRELNHKKGKTEGERTVFHDRRKFFFFFLRQHHLQSLFLSLE